MIPLFSVEAIKKHKSLKPKIVFVKDKPFNFHGALFTIKVLSSETNGSYTIPYVIHPPSLGPTLHMHPKGSEPFT